MKTIAINGSARKKHNTATLLKNVLAGTKSKGAQTELVHLYDQKYKGCTGCYACKRIGGKSYGLFDELDRAAVCRSWPGQTAGHFALGHEKILGNCELMLCHETHWLLDYSKHVNTVFDPIARAKRCEEVFPQDCVRAYELGAKLAAAAKTEN